MLNRLEKELLYNKSEKRIEQIEKLIEEIKNEINLLELKEIRLDNKYRNLYDLNKKEVIKKLYDDNNYKYLIQSYLEIINIKNPNFNTADVEQQIIEKTIHKNICNINHNKTLEIILDKFNKIENYSDDLMNLGNDNINNLIQMFNIIDGYGELNEAKYNELNNKDNYIFLVTSIDKNFDQSITFENNIVRKDLVNKLIIRNNNKWYFNYPVTVYDEESEEISRKI